MRAGFVIAALLGIGRVALNYVNSNLKRQYFVCSLK
jgi:hypothetical protein